MPSMSAMTAAGCPKLQAAFSVPLKSRLPAGDGIRRREDRELASDQDLAGGPEQDTAGVNSLSPTPQTHAADSKAAFVVACEAKKW